jgi:hypothetical protein
MAETSKHSLCTGMAPGKLPGLRPFRTTQIGCLAFPSMTNPSLSYSRFASADFSLYQSRIEIRIPEGERCFCLAFPNLPKHVLQRQSPKLNNKEEAMQALSVAYMRCF